MCLCVLYSLMLYGGLVLAAFGGWESFRAIRHEATGKNLNLEVYEGLTTLRDKIKDALTFSAPETDPIETVGRSQATAFGTAHLELSGAGLSASGEVNLTEIEQLEIRISNIEKEADRRERIRQKEQDQLRTELITMFEKLVIASREAQAKLNKIDAEALNIQMRGALYVAGGLVLSISATVLDTLFKFDHPTIFG